MTIGQVVTIEPIIRQIQASDLQQKWSKALIVVNNESSVLETV